MMTLFRELFVDPVSSPTTEDDVHLGGAKVQPSLKTGTGATGGVPAKGPLTMTLLCLVVGLRTLMSVPSWATLGSP